MDTLTTTIVNASVTSAVLSERGVQHRFDADISSTTGDYFFEVDVTRDLVVFASFSATEDDSSFGIYVQSRRENDYVSAYGEVGRQGPVVGAVAAALIQDAVRAVILGQPIG